MSKKDEKYYLEKLRALAKEIEEDTIKYNEDLEAETQEEYFEEGYIEDEEKPEEIYRKILNLINSDPFGWFIELVDYKNRPFLLVHEEAWTIIEIQRGFFSTSFIVTSPPDTKSINYELDISKSEKNVLLEAIDNLKYKLDAKKHEQTLKKNAERLSKLADELKSMKFE